MADHVYKTPKYRYFIKTELHKNTKKLHHYLEYKNRVIDIPFGKEIIEKHFIEKYIKSFCISPDFYGHSRLCKSMFIIYDGIKKKHPKLTKKILEKELIMRKLLAK